VTKVEGGGRVSFIVPSGSDAEALLSTLTSLSEGVTFPDWEAVIVVNDGAMKELLGGISGDLKIVDASTSLTDNLSLLYNRGAEAASGEFFVFMTPGIAYIKGEGLAEAMKDGVAGMPIKNADMTPYCLGIGFDFNFTPFFIKEEAASNAERRTQNAERSTQNAVRATLDVVGGGLIGINRESFIAVGGFDEGIANHLIEADICLAAKDKGYSISYIPDCLGVVYKSEAVEYWKNAERNGPEDKWKRKIKFFAKWCGKLPKDDDIIKFMGDALKV
jgi:glycosyltransferase involved in cell wall biosynthesis